MSSFPPRAYNPRGSDGRFVHQPFGRPPVSPYKALMFSDEHELDKGRIIDDFHWRAQSAVQAEQIFDRLVTQLTSGAETARPSLYRAGEVYRLDVHGTVRVKVKLAYPMGHHWRYQLELVDYPGAKPLLNQSQMVALRPVQLFYQGYANYVVDPDWGDAQNYGETKDHSKVA